MTKATLLNGVHVHVQGEGWMDAAMVWLGLHNLGSMTWHHFCLSGIVFAGI
jgi:hypothetical protein